ncbi:MAG: carboxypeptidase regulatory-like domain-containing protein, partial [bacterium]|nr:carboxypeptidase regulatory-like domain-containing protein [bacterium]
FSTAFAGQKIDFWGAFNNKRVNPGPNFRLKSGQLIQHRLFPDSTWELELRLNGTGYGKIEIKDIVVKAGQVTEVNVPIDIDDKTGVEGTIVDAQGNPAKYVEICFFHKDKTKKGSYECFADANGYFRITGIPEGFYKINVYDDGKVYYYKKNLIIEINRHILLHKDIALYPSKR